MSTSAGYLSKNYINGYSGTIARFTPVKLTTASSDGGLKVTRCAAMTDVVVGIAIDDADAVNDHITVADAGIVPVIAGDTITAGQFLILDSGDYTRVVPITSVMSTAAFNRTIIGQALEGGADGERITMRLLLIPASV